MSAPNAPGRRRGLVVALAAAALALSSCATAEPSSTPAAAGSVGTGPGQCGSVPTVAPKDADTVLSGLPAEITAQYNGLQTPVQASAWTGFTPTHAAPYRVAILWNPPFNSFATDTLKGLTAELEASGDVEVVANLAPAGVTDVPGQLQQFNQVLADEPDLIVVLPLAAGPLAESVAAATAAGVPVVSAWNPVGAPGSVGVGLNNFQQAATLAAKVVTDIGGAGNLLRVRGIAGVAQDSEAQAGFDAVLALCPGITVVGTIEGKYSASDAKSATLQFLSANPGAITGVLQSGTMTIGIINAFEQLGRPVPSIADVGASQASVAWAHAHKDSYTEHGAAGADVAIGSTVATVALKVLAGDGPVVNQIIAAPYYIDASNIDEVYDPSWTTASTGNAAASDDPFMTDAQLAPFFTAAS